MADLVQDLREMRRVTRHGGMVAACVWDHAGGCGPLIAFWSAVRELDPAADDEPTLPVSAKVIWPACSRRPGWAVRRSLR
jgi:hypothetical protein